MNAPLGWWDFVNETGVPPEVFDPQEGDALDDVTLRGLLDRGISIGAIVSPWSVRRASVGFLPGCDRYFPLRLGNPALIFAIIGYGIVDFAAWDPAEQKIGTRFGVGACLGQGQVGRDGLGTTGPPLPVFRTPLSWLQRHRRGIVIVDSDAASHFLADIILLPEDEDHADDLDRRLRVRPPIIVRRRPFA